MTMGGVVGASVAKKRRGSAFRFSVYRHEVGKASTLAYGEKLVQYPFFGSIIHPIVTLIWSF
ncbi:MAG: hypothetical protein P8J01_06885 [Acidimicrobiales bacterium]|nr:hypothetical protein [Acidimicrobiales bacterium]